MKDLMVQPKRNLTANGSESDTDLMNILQTLQCLWHIYTTRDISNVDGKEDVLTRQVHISGQLVGLQKNNVHCLCMCLS